MKGAILAAGVLVLFTVSAWAAAEWKAPATAKTTKNSVEKLSGVKVGESLYQENCVICHGKGGKGDGEAAVGMNPKPKSLVSRAIQSQTDGELFWKISEGREAMPSWKGLSEKERWSLVVFLRSLAGKK